MEAYTAEGESIERLLGGPGDRASYLRVSL
jgi:hypothetical protein